MEKGHAERLVPMIREVLADAAAGVDEIDCILVTRGPGTFTGVRIGIGVARALALVTGARVFTAGTLRLLAHQARAELGLTPEDLAQKDLAVAVEARRDELYVQLFGEAPFLSLTEPLLVSPERALALLRDRDALVAGSGACRLRNLALKAGRSLAARLTELEPDARYLLDLDDTQENRSPQPLYIRAPDAKPQEGNSLACGS
jgi:tRNA threonylcarbamoyladenosine biosynthesis protein TsaB